MHAAELLIRFFVDQFSSLLPDWFSTEGVLLHPIEKQLMSLEMTQ